MLQKRLTYTNIGTLDATNNYGSVREYLFDITVVIIYNVTNFFMYNKYYVHLNTFSSKFYHHPLENSQTWELCLKF